MSYFLFNFLTKKNFHLFLMGKPLCGVLWAENDEPFDVTMIFGVGFRSCGKLKTTFQPGDSIRDLLIPKRWRSRNLRARVTQPSSLRIARWICFWIRYHGLKITIELTTIWGICFTFPSIFFKANLPSLVSISPSNSGLYQTLPSQSGCYLKHEEPRRIKHQKGGNR